MALTPFLDRDGLVLYQGDALAVLRELPSESVDLCLTSPPFFGLRDYGTGRWEGGDPACGHLAPSLGGPRSSGDHFKSTADEARRRVQYGARCGRCGAVRTDDQIGLEESPDAYIANLVAVFREVRRLLRPSGVLLVEIGDTSAWNRSYQVPDSKRRDVGNRGGQRVPNGLKQKDLIGVPWMLAFALRADGWYLRAEYIWARPNPMPESVGDRCTRAHSQVFHLTKSARYFWDAEAIREDAVMKPQNRTTDGRGPKDRGYADHRKVPGMTGKETKSRTVRPGVDVRGGGQGAGEMSYPAASRNARSVWTIPTEPKGLGVCPVCRAFWTRNAPEQHCGVDVVAHFAAFPAALAERAILAGSSAAGVCPGCGAPWEWLVEEETLERFELDPSDPRYRPARYHERRVHDGANGGMRYVTTETLGWEPTCACALDPVPSIVLDPFSGSGTTMLAARRLGRHAVAVELNPQYCEMAARRLADPDAVLRAAETSSEPTQLVIG